VYATCSLLADENEVVANAFAADHPQFQPLDAGEALAKAHVEQSQTLVADGCLRLWPHRHGTDGFFAAVWQREA
jgi:16S rRNA (cytosine967-C5)-methyltransferase